MYSDRHNLITGDKNKKYLEGIDETKKEKNYRDENKMKQ